VFNRKEQSALEAFNLVVGQHPPQSFSASDCSSCERSTLVVEGLDLCITQLVDLARPLLESAMEKSLDSLSAVIPPPHLRHTVKILLRFNDKASDFLKARFD
jgi:hypothetical protein